MPEAIVPERFGTLPDGRDVDAYVLANDEGTRIKILTYGGVIQSLHVRDREGRSRNVVLGLPTLQDYVERSPYFGAIVGRFANRIADGRFTLDGQTFDVSINEPPSSVHGGEQGFDRKVWSAEPFEDGSWTGLQLHYLSPDGEEGYPGNLSTTVTYRLHRRHASLRVDYRATTDRPTVVNLTNHSFFNLAGEGTGSILGHEVTLNARHYLPIGPDLLPTGQVLPVEGTPMDFGMPHTVGERIRGGFDQLVLAGGYDHNYVIDRAGAADGELVLAARVREPVDGLTLEVWTTEPGLDFYTGNFLDGTLAGTTGRTYRQSDGLAIEPEHFSNSPNLPHFPDCRLDPGAVYGSSTEYRFLT